MSFHDVTTDPLEMFDRVAHEAVKLFPELDQPKIELLNYSENSTYLVNDTNGNKTILRVCRPGYHTKAEIEGEISWLQSIAEKTPIEVALPILGKNICPDREIGWHRTAFPLRDVHLFGRRDAECGRRGEAGERF